MTSKDLPQPGPEEPKNPRYPHAAQLAEAAKKLPWPDQTNDRLRIKFEGIKSGQVVADKASTENTSDYRPNYWVIGKIMDGDHLFIENYLSWGELGTSDTQVVIDRLKEGRKNANKEGMNAAFNTTSVRDFELRTLGYETRYKLGGRINPTKTDVSEFEPKISSGEGSLLDRIKARIAFKLRARTKKVERDTKSDNQSIDEFEPRALEYEKEQGKYFQEVGDGYVDVLAVLNWAKVLDESKRLGIPVEEHPEFEDYNLEGSIISPDRSDARLLSEQINDQVQSDLILESIQRDPTGLNLVKLRENAVKSRLLEEGQNPDQHPWFIGFQQGKQRYEQLVHYLINPEDMTA